MANTSNPAPDPARNRAVIYARVSSKEQEKEGFSIPAQLKLLKEYATAQGFAIANEYVDVETAKQNLRVAKIQLIRLLNDQTPVEQFDVTGPYDFAAPPQTLDEFRRIALDTRPDLKAACRHSH